MTFASLSDATNESLRIFDKTQNSLDLIQNSMVTKEIHNQDETSFCWAFSISTMLRQSLRNFLSSLRNQASADPVSRPFNAAHIHLMSNEFHKKLR